MAHGLLLRLLVSVLAIVHDSETLPHVLITCPNIWMPLPVLIFCLLESTSDSDKQLGKLSLGRVSHVNTTEHDPQTRVMPRVRPRLVLRLQSRFMERKSRTRSEKHVGKVLDDGSSWFHSAGVCCIPRSQSILVSWLVVERLQVTSRS